MWVFGVRNSAAKSSERDAGNIIEEDGEPGGSGGPDEYFWMMGRILLNDGQNSLEWWTEFSWMMNRFDLNFYESILKVIKTVDKVILKYMCVSEI